MAIERTYVMIKPDGVARGLVGEIVGRFERKGLRVADELRTIDEDPARRHYAEHATRGSSPISSRSSPGGRGAMLLGRRPEAVVRTIMGPTNPGRPHRAPSAVTSAGRHREPRAWLGLA